jgi:GcrA cell cycle regulator
MQSTDWAPEHTEALREYLARGMSFSETVNIINARFKTAYTRSAAIGRARRIGFGRPGRPNEVPKLQDIKPQDIKPQEIKPQEADLPWLGKLRERHIPERSRLLPVLERSQPVELRCVSIVPQGFRWWTWNPAIAATLMGAMRRVKPSPSAAIRSAKNQATARRIST